jgi:hypothetical protein
MGSSERRRASRAVAVALAVGLTAFLGSAPAHSQGDDGACRISGGYAALFHDVALPDGSFAYRGVMILRTRACGDGPKGIDGSFHPLVGTPAKCTPVETPRIDESRCSFEGLPGLGGLAGSPVLVQATGHTSGINNDHVHDDDTLEKLQDSRIQPGVVVESAECVLELPEDGGQRACTLF